MKTENMDQWKARKAEGRPQDATRTPGAGEQEVPNTGTVRVQASISASEPAHEPAAGKKEEEHQDSDHSRACSGTEPCKIDDDATTPEISLGNTQGTQHYVMATPPGPDRTAVAREGLCHPPPGLARTEYPELSSDLPPRHEERTIAQRNLSAAKKNLKSLFGQGLPLDKRNPIAEKRNMRDLFGHEVEIMPTIVGVTRSKETLSPAAKKNAECLFG